MGRAELRERPRTTSCSQRNEEVNPIIINHPCCSVSSRSHRPTPPSFDFDDCPSDTTCLTLSLCFTDGRHERTNKWMNRLRCDMAGSNTRYFRKQAQETHKARTPLMQRRQGVSEIDRAGRAACESSTLFTIDKKRRKIGMLN